MIKVTHDDIDRSYLILALLQVAEATCDAISQGHCKHASIEMASAATLTIRHARELVSKNHDVLERFQSRLERDKS